MIRYLTELSMDAFIKAARKVPYQNIQSELFPGIDLWIRRDDLIDPLISGNKSYKLIFNLLEARKQGRDTIVTCGGAWSNHIHATAAAGQRFGFKTIGIIRGERPLLLSAMLQDAERFGMELRFVARSVYRERGSPDFLRKVGSFEENFWFVPEGGANEYGAAGVQVLWNVIDETKPKDFDEYWLACGTGLTLGALARECPYKGRLVGVPVLSAQDAITQEVARWASVDGNQRKLEVIGGAHHGGYAKVNSALVRFQCRLEAITGVPFDHVYMAKLAHALAARCDEVHSSKDAKGGKSILLVHTGGVQGRRGLPQRHPG